MSNATVAGVHHLLHTHSFKHYGLNEAYDRGITQLMQQEAAVEQVTKSGREGSMLSHQAIVPASQDSSTAVWTSSSNAVKEQTLSAVQQPSESQHHASQQPSQTHTKSIVDERNHPDKGGKHLLTVPPATADTDDRQYDKAVLRSLADIRSKHAIVSAHGYYAGKHTGRLVQQQVVAASDGVEDTIWRGRVLARELSAPVAPHLASPVPHVSHDNPQAPSAVSNTQLEKLLEVHHPCMHAGYRQRYQRISYGGLTPTPSHVMLLGAPDWHACLRLASAVVNASAPCQRHAHGHSCRLGALQPPFGGQFIALTGSSLL